MYDFNLVKFIQSSLFFLVFYFAPIQLFFYIGIFFKKKLENSSYKLKSEKIISLLEDYSLPFLMLILFFSSGLIKIFIAFFIGSSKFSHFKFTTWNFFFSFIMSIIGSLLVHYK